VGASFSLIGYGGRRAPVNPPSGHTRSGPRWRRGERRVRDVPAIRVEAFAHLAVERVVIVPVARSRQGGEVRAPELDPETIHGEVEVSLTLHEAQADPAYRRVDDRQLFGGDRRAAGSRGDRKSVV